jgi:tetratricopeptide (TPR) repeat protein
MGLFSRLFGKKEDRDQQFAEASRAREEFIAHAKIDDEAAEFNIASGLMLSKRFAESIDAYRALAVKYPEQAGVCESQVGAALYFLDRFDDAIASYLHAITLGVDRSMMDDNVFEACEAIAEKSGEARAFQRYLDAFPDGQHAKKARKQLAS